VDRHDNNSTDFDARRFEAESPQAPSGGNMLDPEFLGLNQDFAAESEVKKEWDIIRVEKPSKERVFRTHPDPKFRLKTVLLVLKEDSEQHIVLPQLRAALAGESTCGVYHLIACVSRTGTPFLWPIRAADPDGKWNIWHQSAFQIAEKAAHRWCRMQANREAGHYTAEYDQKPVGQRKDSVWPDLTFPQWLELAFRGHTIASLDHPVLKRLRLED
jgi:hypothetical protein